MHILLFSTKLIIKKLIFLIQKQQQYKSNRKYYLKLIREREKYVVVGYTLYNVNF